MSYAIRNTIVLCITLLLMAAAGWGFIYLTQKPTLEYLTESLEKKGPELENLKNVAANYEVNLHNFITNTYKLENHDKELMQNNRVPTVYDYIRTLNQGTANTEVNFTWTDSTNSSQYGYNAITINGTGAYRNFYNFVKRLEESKPLHRITSLQLQNISELERLNYVRFEIGVNSYYDRQRPAYTPEMRIVRTSMGISHNPFFPLIHNVPPNEENLLNIDESRLIALSRNTAYIINQQGSLTTLKEGDRVYLGTLETINFTDNTVTFLLNRGGLTDRVTLNLNPS